VRRILLLVFVGLGGASALAEDNYFIGLGRNGQGFVEVRWGAGRSNAAWGWARLPWSGYNAAVGETRAATGDVDGDGNDELLVGLSSYPAGGGGFVGVFDDCAKGCQFLRWVRVRWAAYNARNGETTPACGDLDGDGDDEIVVGLGPTAFGAVYVCDLAGPLGWARLPLGTPGDGSARPACGDVDGDGRDEIVLGTGRGGGARVAVLDDAAASFALLRWLPTPQDAYAAAVGEARPACGDVDADGDAEILVGRGPYGAGGGYIARYASLRDGAALTGWTRVPWTNYDSRDGETRPALGDTDGDRRDELIVGLGPGGMGYYCLFRPDGTFDRFQRVSNVQRVTPDGSTWPAIARGRSTAMFVALHLDYNLSSGAPLDNSALDAIVSRCSRERVTKIIVGTWSTRGIRRGLMYARREPGKADLLEGDGSSAFLDGGRGFSLQHLIDAGRAARPPVEVFASIVSFGENRGVSAYQDSHSDFLRNTVIRYHADNYPGLAGVYLDYIRYSGRVDTFESGEIGYLPLQMSGSAGWRATQTSAGAGTWSARSGAIGNSQTSTTEMTVDIPVGGTFSFKRRVSSESGGDTLRFSIDSVEKARWSGEAAWATSSHTVTAGTHRFTWSYVKDGGTATGSDAAWIDDITVPTVDHARVTRLVQGIKADLTARGMRVGAFLMGWAGVSGWRSYLPTIGQHWEDLSEQVDILSPMAYSAWSSYYTTLDSIKNRVREKTRWAVDAAMAKGSKARVQSIIANYSDGSLTATPLTIWWSLAAENEGGSDEFSIFRWGHMDRGSETGEWAAFQAYMRNGPPPSGTR